MTPVNLYSDTQTRPTRGMREAIAMAEVGDEQRRLDPTTIALEERVAQLLGHEAAVFLPTGSMCNQIALLVHIRTGGDELLIDRTAHPSTSRAGARPSRGRDDPHPGWRRGHLRFGPARGRRSTAR